MSDITEKDPHRRYYPEGQCPAFGVVYWNGNSASPESKATSAEVGIFGRNGWLTIATYTLPDQRFVMEGMIRAFHTVFEEGGRAAKRDIRKMLGCER